jgi:hypothetical protein
MRIRLRRLLFTFALSVAVLLAFPIALEAVEGSSPTSPSDGSLVARLPKVRVPRLAPGAPRFATAAREGVDELLGSGDGSIVGWKYATGLWGGHIKANWWQSALAVLTLARYAEQTHSQDPRFEAVLDRIYARNIYKPRSTAPRDFANEFMDDTAWWGQAWLEASRYELSVRHDPAEAAKFLRVAEWDAAYINASPRICGGIPWALNRPPDAVTSAEFIALAGGLASYLEKPGIFYDPQRAAALIRQASDALIWLEDERLVDLRSGAVIDGLTASCQRTGGAMTYTEGEVADALVRLGSALHNPSYYGYAANFFRYALSWYSHLSVHGVLQERCENHPASCDRLGYRLDLPAFKGIFVNAVVDWTAATGSHALIPFLRAQATAVVDHAIRGPDGTPGNCQTPQSCQFAFNWTGRFGPHSDAIGVTLGGQESAIDALTAVLPQGS